VPRDPKPGAPLSKRERQVLRLAARGLTRQEIAAEMSISPRTVANHLSHAYAKLEVHNRSAAVYKVARREVSGAVRPV
jgi:DNA-binding CsgD family transcriptional regulator